MQRIVPLLFIDPDQLQLLSKIQEITLSAGAEWNESFQGLFDVNKCPLPSTATTPTDGAADGGDAAAAAAAGTAEGATETPTEPPTEASAEMAEEGGMSFAVWKTLLPQLFESAEERVRVCQCVCVCHCANHFAT